MTTFNWGEYLTLAQYLLNNDHQASQEAIYRTVVSRSYYAAFRQARDVAERRYKLKVEHGEQDHRNTIEIYRTYNREDISKKLWLLKKWRVSCDYESQVTGLQAIANSAIDLSQKVFDGLKR
jgi:uncharacterized protein (UPF0332 family)